ncbi:MAG TPA: dCTP deaminase, partial [Caulobacteraceae bacterium]|nr:dCTP deaminase [Caulobacteraceae bacterium]
MILTDREIGSAIKHRYVTIDPVPDADAYSSTSIDLKLSRNFTSWTASAGVIIGPGRPEYNYNALKHLQTTKEVDHFTLAPQRFVLAWTEEEVEIPMQSRLAARVEGKSSLARLGIGIHVTAPTIHCGFKGQIQLEMFNFGPHEVQLDAGMRVCQLIFEQTLGTPEKGYSGSF